MYYNLLIVDDDTIVRDGLTKNIDWHTHKINVIGCATDGEEAIEIIKKNTVHIVITDIKMPFLDGIGLSAYLYENYPQVKIVLLSGFKEFEYAREAIRLNVKDYILKPIDDRKLTDLMIRIVNEIRLEQMEKKRLSDSKLLERQNFLKAWIENMHLLDESATLQQLKNHHICYSQYVQLAVIRCNDFFNDDYHHQYMEGSLLKFAVWNIANELLEDKMKGLVFEYLGDQILFIYFDSTYNSPHKKELENLLTRLIENTSRLLHTTLSIGISATFQLKSEIHLAYKQCQETFKFIPVKRGLPLINYDNLHSLQTGFHTQLHQFLSSLKAIVTMPKANELLDPLYNQLQASLIERSMVLSDNMHLLFTHIALQTHHLLIGDLKVNPSKYEKLIEDHVLHLRGLKTPEDYLTTSKEFVAYYLKEVYKDHDSSHDSHINRATTFIKENYSQETIRLKQVASHIHVNPSYLSILFKKHLGMSFSDYVLKVRMDEAAKRLTLTNKRISDISDAVGFSNAQYFSVSFKNYFGKTPKEYRKRD